MKLHTQLEYNPAFKGSCLQTTIACILDKEIFQVPNFHTLYWFDEQEGNFELSVAKELGIEIVDNDIVMNTATELQISTFNDRVTEFKQLYAKLLKIYLASEGYEKVELNQLQLIEKVKENPKFVYLAIGLSPSPRNRYHVVIMGGEQMIWDVHPSRAGLVSVDSYWEIRKVF